MILLCIMILELFALRYRVLVSIFSRRRSFIGMRRVIAVQVIENILAALATSADLVSLLASSLLSVDGTLGLEVGTGRQTIAVGLGVPQTALGPLLLFDVLNSDLATGQAHRRALAPLVHLILHFAAILLLRGVVNLQEGGIPSQAASAEVPSVIVAQKILEHSLVLVGVHVPTS